MTIVRHELRQGRTALAIWTGSIAFLLAACVFLFPGMRSQMAAVSEAFASMGGFTAAFGMDRLRVGTLTGFYAVESGSILGLGGAFFASLTGASALSKDERDRTADLLLTHPISRGRVVTEKLAAVLAQIAALDLAALGAALLSIRLIGEAVPWREILLLHSAYALLHIELACVCIGLSAFLRRGGAGIGIGLAAALYALELIANMTGRAGALRYITPFSYCEGADILAKGRLDAWPVAAGMLFAAAGAAMAYCRYCGKDIR